MRTQFFAPAVIVAAASLLNNQADALKLETQAQVMADDYNQSNWSHPEDMGLAGNFGNYGSMGAKGRAVGAANTGLDRMGVPATNPERRGANLGQARSGAPPGNESSLGLRRKPAGSGHSLGVTRGNRDSFGPITGDKEPFGETKAARSLRDISKDDIDEDRESEEEQDTFDPFSDDDRKTPSFEHKAPKESLGDLLRVDGDRKTSSSGSGHPLGVTRGNNSDFGPIRGEKIVSNFERKSSLAQGPSRGMGGGAFRSV